MLHLQFRTIGFSSSPLATAILVFVFFSFATAMFLVIPCFLCFKGMNLGPMVPQLMMATWLQDRRRWVRMASVGPGVRDSFIVFPCRSKNIQDMAVGQNLVPLVNIKIAGKWMFIPLKMVLIGIDPYPYIQDIAHDCVVVYAIFTPFAPHPHPISSFQQQCWLHGNG